MIRQFSLAPLALLVAAAFAGCDADLEDGNPCRAIIHANCERIETCDWFVAGHDTSTCLDTMKDSEFASNCAATAGEARRCADAIDAASCEASEWPAPCDGYYYDGSSRFPT